MKTAFAFSSAALVMGMLITSCANNTAELHIGDNYGGGSFVTWIIPNSMG